MVKYGAVSKALLVSPCLLLPQAFPWKSISVPEIKKLLHRGSRRNRKETQSWYYIIESVESNFWDSPSGSWAGLFHDPLWLHVEKTKACFAYADPCLF